MADIISCVQRNNTSMYCVAELKVTLLTSKSRPVLSLMLARY